MELLCSFRQPILFPAVRLTLGFQDGLLYLFIEEVYSIKAKLRRSLAMLLSLFLSAGMLCGSAMARWEDDGNKSGTLGENLRWAWNDGSFNLSFFGFGATPDWSGGTEAPWHSFISKPLASGQA